MSDLFRRRLKAEAIRLRGGTYACCDLRGHRIGYYGDLHELIPRSMVNKQLEAARKLIFSVELTAYLSPDAHRTFHDCAPTLQDKDRMFQSIYRVLANQEGTLANAHRRVERTLADLQDLLKVPIPIILPLPEDYDGEFANL